MIDRSIMPGKNSPRLRWKLAGMVGLLAILVADDEPQIRRSLQVNLEAGAIL